MWHAHELSERAASLTHHRRRRCVSRSTADVDTPAQDTSDRESDAAAESAARPEPEPEPEPGSVAEPEPGSGPEPESGAAESAPPARRQATAEDIHADLVVFFNPRSVYEYPEWLSRDDESLQGTVLATVDGQPQVQIRWTNGKEFWVRQEDLDMEVDLVAVELLRASVSLLNAGDAALRGGDVEMAMATFEQVLDMDPRNRDAQMALEVHPGSPSRALRARPPPCRRRPTQALAHSLARAALADRAGRAMRVAKGHERF